MKIDTKIKAFSLVESLVAFALFGMILLMLSPLIMGRSQKTAEVHCVNGGSQVVHPQGSSDGNNWDNNAVLDIQPGMSKIYITLARTGKDGDYDGDIVTGNGRILSMDRWRNGTRSGNDEGKVLSSPGAGKSYNPVYKEIDLLKIDPSSSFLKIGVKVFDDGDGVYPQGIWGCKKRDNGQRADDECVWQEIHGYQNIFYRGNSVISDQELVRHGLTLSDSEERRTSKRTTLRTGIPYNANFLGPLYGVGGRGADLRFGINPEATYAKDRNKYRQKYDCSYTSASPYSCDDSAFVLFEWPTDCIVTEDVDN